MIEISDYKKLPNESEKEYILRICKLREVLNLRWAEVRDIINSNF